MRKIFYSAMFAALVVAPSHASATPEPSLSGQVMPPQLAFQAGGFEMTTAANIHRDAVWIQNGPSHSESDFRRVELGLKGKLAENLAFKWVSDFADDQHEWVDLLVQYRPADGARGWYVTAGNFKEPLGMEQLQSSSATVLMERAAAISLSPGRNLGGTVTWYNPQWSVTGGIFTENIEPGSDNVNYALSGRATYAHYFESRPDTLLHAGVSASFREMDRVRYSAKPETGIVDYSVVNTGTLQNVDAVRLLGLEAAYRQGNWLFQSEYLQAHVDLAPGLGEADFKGWYVLGNWIVTGEVRPYSTADAAVFKGIKPRQPFNAAQGYWGAWELGVRIGSLDLDDGIVQGGVQRSYSAGVNWYPTSYMRLMGNVSKVKLENSNPIGPDDPLVMGLRLQLVF